MALVSEESTKERDHYSGDQQMLNEHVVNPCVVYIYGFGQIIIDPETPTNMGYCK